MKISFTKRISPNVLRDFCVKALCSAGLGKMDAGIAADVLVSADECGVFSHGTAQLGNYVRKIQAGGIVANAKPEVVMQGQSWAIVDGHAASGMTTAVAAMEIAIQKASNAVVSYVGVRNSNHFGAAGYYAQMALKRNMIGIAMSNTDPCMTAPGGRTSILGTNPLAYALPTGAEQPVFLDIALSATAASKIHAAKALGESIPEGWLVDADGLPTNQIDQWPGAGSQLPMAGHKGYGLAILVETLSGVLAGGAVGTEVKGWIAELSEAPGTGHSFLVIDAGQIMPIQQFKTRMDQMVRGITGAPKAKGYQRIFMPGEMEFEKRADSRREGIVLPEIALMSLERLAMEIGFDFQALFEDRRTDGIA